MAEEPAESKIVQVHQRLSEGHKTVYADGAFVQQTSTGSMHVAWYIESQTMPPVVQVKASNEKAEQLPLEDEPTVTREVQVTLVLPQQALVGLLHFLATTFGYTLDESDPSVPKYIQVPQKSNG